MNIKRSFDSERIYTENEIRRICPDTSVETGEREDRTKYEYLVAEAEVEYWFIRDGAGWKVDHTWASVILVPKEKADN